ncbi:MAG: ABC transporter ATP-binding protein [Minwuiales bacterium]|nr:ABC transporter ATP-binding protein [Minwuiales bacterium]
MASVRTAGGFGVRSVAAMSLKLEGVIKRVGPETHLQDIDLDISAGSLTVLLGPTLAGKTSLMRLMAGLDRPTAGRVVVDGADVTGQSVKRRDVAMVYQQFINYPSFTVYENIASPLRRAGLPRDEIDRRVRSVAELLHIDGLLDRLPAALSGGQQQRTALARGLVKEAGLLLLDEPLVNLDYKLREELREELLSIFAERKSIVVYATTEPLEALMLGGNVVVLDEGRVLQQGPTIDVYTRPASIRIGGIFSDPPINLIDGAVEGDRLLLGDAVAGPRSAHLGAVAQGRYRFGVRSNALYVARHAATDLEIGGTVELAEISGSETFIHVAHNGVSWVAQEEGIHSFALGDQISIYLDPAALFVFDRQGGLVAAPPRQAA